METKPRTLKQVDARTPQETKRIRETTLKRLLSTPPKRHDEMVAERRNRKQRQATATKVRDGNK